MRRTWWQSGDYNAICDVCGFKRKASQLVQRWDGLMVCSPSVKEGCWEIRHPQEMLRPIPDQVKLPWTRPEPQDQFISITYNSVANQCSVQGIYGMADYGEADCAQADIVNEDLIL